VNSCLQSLVGKIGLAEPKIKLDFSGISKYVVLPKGISSSVALNEIE
jgi:hypothetical protein